MTYLYPGGGGSRLKETPNFFKKASPPPCPRVGRPLSKGLSRAPSLRPVGS